MALASQICSPTAGCAPVIAPVMQPRVHPRGTIIGPFARRAEEPRPPAVGRMDSPKQRTARQQVEIPKRKRGTAGMTATTRSRPRKAAASAEPRSKRSASKRKQPPRRKARAPKAVGAVEELQRAAAEELQ